VNCLCGVGGTWGAATPVIALAAEGAEWVGRLWMGL
jgi:hypothetical protein